MFALTNSVIISLLTPILAKTNYWAVFAARYLMGFGEGFIMPSLLSMASHWFPANERASFAAIYTSGNQIGAMLTVPISSFLCSSEYFGWESIFYFFGSVGLALIILWFIFVSDTPEKNKFITNAEEKYLHETIGQHHKKRSDATPWKSLLTSVPLFGAIFAQISFSFSIVLMQSFLPLFMKQVLQVSLKTNGLFSILPFLTQIISKNAIGNIGDILKKKNILTNTQAVKIFQCSGNIGSGICFLLLAFFIDCDTVPLALVVLGFYGVFIACGIPGFFTALLSIAPKYSGTIGSVALTIAAMTISVVPFFVAFFNKNGTPEEWRKLFLIPVGLHFSSAIVFGILGSAEIQEWAKSTNIPEKENLQEMKEEEADLFDKLSIAE
uniref:Major facilitator superfamily (MFS) profile domain-containing protein n=1 Tax=Panagrolaimus sp. JU765 TaxID=591449 RepID=A0AC34QIG3_9BILA